MINLLTIVPHQALEKAWLNEEVYDLPTAQNLLSQEFKKNLTDLIRQANETKCEIQKVNLTYQHTMGTLLSSALQELIIQQNSEILQYQPPPLTLFAKKLQIALYLQLWEFQHELYMDSKETNFFPRLQRLLEDDIALFKSTDLNKLPWTAVAVSQELEKYYENRFS